MRSQSINETTVNTATNYLWNVCDPIEAGVDYDERIGLKILIRNISIRGFFTTQDAIPRMMTMLLVYDTRYLDNATPPTWLDLFENTLPLSWREPLHRARYKILKRMDRWYNPVGALYTRFSFYKRMRFLMTFTGTAADRSDKGLFIIYRIWNLENTLSTTDTQKISYQFKVVWNNCT